MSSTFPLSESVVTKFNQLTESALTETPLPDVAPKTAPDPAALQAKIAKMESALQEIYEMCAPNVDADSDAYGPSNMNMEAKICSSIAQVYEGNMPF